MKIIRLLTGSSVLACLVLASACSKGDGGRASDEGEKIYFSESSAADLAANGQIAESADYYVRLAEMLFEPEGMQYADDMLDRALALSPEHPKANLLSALTKPWLALRGIKSRGRDLFRIFRSLDKPSQIRHELACVNEGIRGQSYGFDRYPETHAWFRQPVEPTDKFRSFDQIQAAFGDGFLAALDTAAAKLKKVADSNQVFDVAIDQGRWGRRHSDSSYYYWNNEYDSPWGCQRNPRTGVTCYVYRSYGGYTTITNGAAPVLNLRMGPAQARILEGSVKGMASHLRVQLAYDLRDLNEFLEELGELQAQFRAYRQGVPTRQLTTALRGHGALLRLRAEQQLDRLPRDAEEILRQALDLAEVSDACGRGGSDFLNSTFICELAKDTQGTRQALDALAGPVQVKVGFDVRTGETVTVAMDFSRFLHNPPRDLKDLLPTRFNRAGQAVHYPDATVGGLFPDGDIIEALTRVGRGPGAR